MNGKQVHALIRETRKKARTERLAAKISDASDPKLIRPVQFRKDDPDDMAIFEAMAKVCPSRTSVGPNITRWLREHKDYILAEAEGK